MPVEETVSKLKQIAETRRSLQVETDDGIEFRAVVERVDIRENKWDDPHVNITLAVLEDDVERLGMSTSTAHISAEGADNGYESVYVDICTEIESDSTEKFTRIGELETVERID